MSENEIGSVAWLARKMADHIEFMVSSGQFRGTLEQYASFPRYRSEEDRTATIAELKRRKDAREALVAPAVGAEPGGSG